MILLSNRGVLQKVGETGGWFCTLFWVRTPLYTITLLGVMADKHRALIKKKDCQIAHTEKLRAHNK